MSESKPDPLDWFNHFAGDAPRCPEYVGLSRAAAEDAARQAGRFRGIRILDLDEEREHGGPIRAWTADARPNRLNLVVRNGTVIAAALF